MRSRRSGPLRVYSIHLSALSKRERLMQIDRLLEFHRSAQVSGGAWTGDESLIDPIEARHMADLDWGNGEAPRSMPTETIVMGDFNSELESDEYMRMRGEIDPCFGRAGHLDSFVDSWTVAKDRFGDRISWWPDPPERSPGHGLTLDYCFVGPGLGHKVKRTWVDASAQGSDHRPYWVELDL